jgi:hypothetical protein
LGKFIGKSLHKEMYTELVGSHLCFSSDHDYKQSFVRAASQYRATISDSAEANRPISAINYRNAHVEAKRNKQLALGSSLATALKQI